MKKYDIIIIGGGASGLAAAAAAKRTASDLRVAIIERLPKVGKKILATGNGRCNLSNSEISVNKYHGSCNKLLDMTNGFSVPLFFESLGLLCEDDGYGRIYPRCRSAASVLDALRLENARLGIDEICGFDVKNIKEINGYDIISGNDIINGRKLILSGGGKSQSALGSNGSLLDICMNMGIKAVPFYPALVPLKTDPALVKPLKGLRAEAAVSFRAKERTIAGSCGEVQFTDGLLSGICVFDLSYLYEHYKDSSEIILDLMPDMSLEELSELLKNIRSIRIQTSSEDYLSGIFTRPLGNYIIKRSVSGNIGYTRDITDRIISRIARKIKSLSFPVIGTAGFERSQVTGGGIPADEINDTFELKRKTGIYVCGEMLDIFGDCGGYNLDFAFSSGYSAGRNAALSAIL